MKSVLCFYDSSLSESPTFYVQATNRSWTSWVKGVSAHLVRLLEKVVECNLVEKYVNIVDNMLGFEYPREIVEFLQEKDITIPADRDIDGETIGSYVPIELHCLLDNSFLDFGDGEIAVYEVNDPLLDDTLDNDNDDGSIFIYVKIIGKVESTVSQPHQQVYKIYNGENIIDVAVEWLYKLNRRKVKNKEETTTNNAAGVEGMELELYIQSEQTTSSQTSSEQDLEEVLADLRRILNDAWKKDERTRKQILKRIHLKWHPDKNKDNVDFCTQVYQMFQFYISKLEKGEQLSDASDDSPSGSPSSWFRGRSGSSRRDFHSTFSSFFDNLGRRRRRFYRTYGDSPDSGFTWTFNESRQNPQPAVFRCWMKQAKHDLGVAERMMTTIGGGGYNWICYILHQVCPQWAGLKPGRHKYKQDI